LVTNDMLESSGTLFLRPETRFDTVTLQVRKDSATVCHGV